MNGEEPDMRRRPRRPRLLAALACAALAGGCAAKGPVPYEPLRESVPDLQGRMLAHVGENLLPFWLENCVDRQHGGYLTVLNRDGSMQSGEKMLVTQARLIWAFSRLWKDGYHDPRIRDAAVQGIEFLRRWFWDPAYEGWFWQVQRDGTPDDMSKKTYGHAFVIYAGVEYYRAFKDPMGLQLAELTFDLIERHAKDPEHPGYVDFMDRQWAPDAQNNGEVKTMNTHLHLLEALTELYMVTGKPAHQQRLREVLDVLTQKCYLPECGCCIDGFYYDWTPAREGFFGERNNITSYGHNVEFAWLMQRAAQALGLPQEPYRSIGLTLVNHAMKYGWDADAGAMLYEGPLTGAATNRVMEWWVQAESAVALDWAYRTTGEGRYMDALRRQVMWVLGKQSDPVYGGWYSTLAPNGTILNESKANVWHACYHDVRACLNVGTGRWE